MGASLVQIGSSKGLRIPKPILERCGFGSEVELRVAPGRLVVMPVTAPRSGWEEAFAEAGTEEEPLARDGLRSRFDEQEWSW